MSAILPNFAKGFKRARKEFPTPDGKLYSQKRFVSDFRHSDGAAISIDSVRNWEQGKNIPDSRTLEELCIFFGCSMDYLFYRTSCREIESQLINEKTGLSEEAIRFLIELQKIPEMRHISDFLSALILDRDSDYMNNLSHIAGAAIGYMVELEKPRFPEGTIDEDMVIGGCTATCQNRFMQFIERYARGIVDANGSNNSKETQELRKLKYLDELFRKEIKSNG